MALRFNCLTIDFILLRLSLLPAGTTITFRKEHPSKVTKLDIIRFRDQANCVNNKIFSEKKEACGITLYIYICVYIGKVRMSIH